MKIKREPQSELERRVPTVMTELLGCVPKLTVVQMLHQPPVRPVSYPVSSTAQHYRYTPDLEVVIAFANQNNADEDGGDTPQMPAAVWRLYVEVTGQVNQTKLQTIAAYVLGLPNAVPVLFVQHLSVESLETCRRLGICCADAAGNGWIAIGDRVYIERIGRKADASFGKNRAIPSLSAPKTEQVLRVLLNANGAAGHVWKLQPLATEAGVSLGQVARVKEILDQMGVTAEVSERRRIGGFRLAHPEEVLQEWAGYVRARNYHAGEEHTYHAIDDPLELQRMLTRKLPSFVANRFALAGEQAADVYAPYTHSPVLSAYVLPDDEIDLQVLVEAMDLDRVTSGVNVVLTTPRDSGVFYLPPDLRESARDARLRERRTPIVSPIQTYLDLQRSGGRAREGAQYLLEHFLRSRWQKGITDDD